MYIKNIGITKSIRINGVNVVVLPGVREYEDSDNLKRLVDKSLDLLIVSNPEVKEGIKKPVVEEIKEPDMNPEPSSKSTPETIQEPEVRLESNREKKKKRRKNRQLNEV